MNNSVEIRTGCAIAGAVAASVLLAGCMSSPTYGTGKTANAQLVDDLTKIVSIGTPVKESQQAYAPRPDIIEPPSGSQLPQPQTSVAGASNPEWLESPEETRARLRQEASEKRNSGYRSPLASSEDNISPEQWDQFKKAKTESKTLRSSQKQLADPPLDYRVPVDSAPQGELGEPEYIKERRREQAAKKKQGWQIGNLWPF